MKYVKQRHIKAALQDELLHVEPSRDIWDRIAPTLPTQDAHRRRRHIPLVVPMILVFVLLSSSIVLAATPYGGQVADWVAEKFGIQLIKKTPQLEEELKQKGAYEVIPGMPLKDHVSKIPGGMSMPSYLPKSVVDFEPHIYLLGDGAGIRWSKGEQPYVELWYHEEAFVAGSKTITNGEPRFIQEVKIGDLSGMAFYDDNGWNLSWVMNGHQYIVLTDISLEEAIYVADSIR